MWFHAPGWPAAADAPAQGLWCSEGAGNGAERKQEPAGGCWELKQACSVVFGAYVERLGCRSHGGDRQYAAQLARQDRVQRRVGWGDSRIGGCVPGKQAGVGTGPADVPVNQCSSQCDANTLHMTTRCASYLLCDCCIGCMCVLSAGATPMQAISESNTHLSP